MKKVLLLLSVALLSLSVSAQDLVSKKGENYLPEAGDWAISFNPDGVFTYLGNVFNTSGNGAPTIESYEGLFVGKCFTSSNEAYRVLVNLGYTTVSNETNPDVASSTVKNGQSVFRLDLGAGKEWRKGSTRLQGYYGADAMIGASAFSNKGTVDNGTNWGKYKDGLGFHIGVAGFIGAEYFILPKLSLGAEYRLGLGFATQGASATEFTGQDTVKGTSASGFYLGSRPDYNPITRRFVPNNGIGVATIKVSLHF